MVDSVKNHFKQFANKRPWGPWGLCFASTEIWNLFFHIEVKQILREGLLPVLKISCLKQTQVNHLKPTQSSLASTNSHPKYVFFFFFFSQISMSTVGDSGLGLCSRIMLEKSYKMGPHKLQSMGPITPLIEVKKKTVAQLPIFLNYKVGPYQL